MHELGIAQEIIRIVHDEADRKNLPRITAVALRIGALAGVDPEALRFGFEASVMATSLERTQLLIEWLPVKGKCRACGREFTVDDLVFFCPACQSADIELTQGEELFIDHLVTE